MGVCEGVGEGVSVPVSVLVGVLLPVLETELTVPDKDGLDKEDVVGVFVIVEVLVGVQVIVRLPELLAVPDLVSVGDRDPVIDTVCEGVVGVGRREVEALVVEEIERVEVFEADCGIWSSWPARQHWEARGIENKPAPQGLQDEAPRLEKLPLEQSTHSPAFPKYFPCAKKGARRGRWEVLEGRTARRALTHRLERTASQPPITVANNAKNATRRNTGPGPISFSLTVLSTVTSSSS